MIYNYFHPLDLLVHNSQRFSFSLFSAPTEMNMKLAFSTLFRVNGFCERYATACNRHITRTRHNTAFSGSVYCLMSICGGGFGLCMNGMGQLVCAMKNVNAMDVVRRLGDEE